MKSEAERDRFSALALTVLLCVVLEGLAVVVVRAFTGNFLGAAVMSAMLLGPVSLWLGPPLYRYLLRGQQG